MPRLRSALLVLLLGELSFGAPPARASDDCAAAKEAARTAQATDVERLRQVLRKGNCYVASQDASRRLVETGAGVAVLLEALKGHDAELQEVAAYGLLAIRDKDERVSEALGKAFLEKRNEERVRVGAAMALSVFSSPRLGPERFLAVLGNESEPIRIRQGAVEIASRIPDALARKTLIDVLKDARFPLEVRATVPRAVAEGEKYWKGTREDMVPTLAAIAADSGQATALRAATLVALHYYRQSPVAIRALEQGRKDKNPAIRRAATPVVD